MFQKLNQEKNLVGRLKQILATTCLGPLLIGVSISWTSPVLPQLEANSSTFHLTKDEASWVGSMLGFGVLSAALPTGYLANRYGIKKCVLALIIPFLLFTVIVVVSRDIYTLCLARFLCGIATGGVSVVSPMYMSEISDSSFRGTLGSFFEFLIYVAVMFVASCGAMVDYITLTITVGALCLMLSSIFIFLPESPTYLMKMGKDDEAENAVRFYCNNSSNVEEILTEIRNTLDIRNHKLGFKQALRSQAVVRGLVASVGLTIFQKFSGMDSLLFYAVSIFQMTESGFNAYTSSIILAFVQLLSAMLNVFIIECANRRVFLFVSTIGMSVCLAVLGIYFQLKENNINFPGFGYIPLASLVVHAFMFSVGLGPILWMINGELFAPDVKGLANDITLTTNWGFLSIVTKVFPIMLFEVGPHYTFYLFSLCMSGCAIFIRFFVPETRGKSLEQIQIELNS